MSRSTGLTLFLEATFTMSDCAVIVSALGLAATFVYRACFPFPLDEER